MAIKILDKFESTAADKILADAENIHDTAQNKKQSEINAYVQEKLTSLEEAGGGSQDINIGPGLGTNEQGALTLSVSTKDFEYIPGTNAEPAKLQIRTTPESGLSRDGSGNLKVNISSQLKRDSGGKIGINIGSGITVGPADNIELKISTEDFMFSADGKLKLSTASVTGGSGISVGSGLTTALYPEGEKIVVNIGTGIGMDSESGKVFVKTRDGLKYTTDDGIKVAVGSGLLVGTGDSGVSIKIGTNLIGFTEDGGLTIDIEKLKVELGLTAS